MSERLIKQDKLNELQTCTNIVKHRLEELHVSKYKMKELMIGNNDERTNIDFELKQK